MVEGDLEARCPRARSQPGPGGGGTPLEEDYRKKYEALERGDTRVMGTADPVVGRYSRRLVDAIRERLDAITPRDVPVGRGASVLEIRIGRDGSIEGVKRLESTGNGVLDDLSLRASRTVGNLGPLPERWPFGVYNFVFIVAVNHSQLGGRWRSD